MDEFQVGIGVGDSVNERRVEPPKGKSKCWNSSNDKYFINCYYTNAQSISNKLNEFKLNVEKDKTKSSKPPYLRGNRAKSSIKKKHSLWQRYIRTGRTRDRLEYI